jgi:hypothetical protein
MTGSQTKVGGIGCLTYVNYSKLHATTKQIACYAEAKRGSYAYHRSSIMLGTNTGSPMLSRTMTAMVV